MARPRTIVGIGEALFDIFPDSERLGGAPLNFAVHAHQLGNEGVMITRIGQDRLGEQIVDELRRREMTLDHVQSDPDHATGTVVIDFDADREPVYQITPGAAWDHLQWDGDLDHLAVQADAVCFGTLAQRAAQARNNIIRFLEASSRGLRLLDVNLRESFYDRRIISRSLELADAVKLNQTELTRIGQLLSLGEDPDAIAAAMIGRYKLDWLAVTAAEQGMAVHTPDGRKYTGQAHPATGEEGDPVGAGDAAAAALVHGVIRRWPWDRIITFANAVGGHVASQPGACPDLPDELKQQAQA